MEVECLAGGGVLNGERLAVEGDAAGKVLAAAVAGVTEDGVAGCGELDSDLVFSACEQVDSEECGAVVGVKELVLEECVS